MNENELEQLTPAVVEVTAGGEVIAVSAIKVKELSLFMKAVAPMLDTFNEADRDNLITELLINHTDSLIKAVAIGTRKSEDFINDLDIDELAELAAAVIEVNTDFFIRKVLPKVRQGIERLGDKINRQAGSSSISASGAQV